jgi:thiamine-phosphate pyrophosphorylase
MNRRLPFTRIAIVPSGILLSDFEYWFECALKLGANAVYLRLREANLYKQALNIINSQQWYLYNSITWILSAEHPELPFWASGLHFKASNNNNKIASALYSHILYKGKSCHSYQDLKEAENLGYDYAFLSPVFSTATHPDVAPIGLEAFKAWVSQVSIPVFALGGVTWDREKELLAAGAYGIAGINCFKRGFGR